MAEAFNLNAQTPQAAVKVLLELPYDGKGLTIKNVKRGESNVVVYEYTDLLTFVGSRPAVDQTGRGGQFWPRLHVKWAVG